MTLCSALTLKGAVYPGLLAVSLCSCTTVDHSVNANEVLRLAESSSTQRNTHEPAPIGLAEMREKYQIDGSTYIDLDGVNLHFADEGEGDPILLLPPSFLNFRAWDGVVEALVLNGYRVIRPDFPSTGLSGVDGKALSGETVDFFERNAEVMALLIEALGLEQVHVIGTSSGGVAGFRLASYHPDKVRRMVLINSAGLPRTRRSDPNRARSEEREWANMLIKPPAYWANLLSRNFFEPADAPDWLVEIAFDSNRRNQEVAPGAYAFRTGDPEEILSGVHAPTLILWGKSNPTVVHLEAEVFQHWMTSAPTVIRKYEGLGHYPYIENRDLVMADILPFLRGENDDQLRQTQRISVSIND